MTMSKPDLPFVMAPAEIRRAADLFTSWLIDYFTALPREPVYQPLAGGELQQALWEPLPEQGVDWEEILRRFADDIAANSRHNSHPRFFGYISGPATPVAALADAMASALNQNVTSWRSAPAATEIERLVIDWLRQLIGLGEGWAGYLTSGGSLANWIALAAARCARCDWDVRAEGLRELPGGGRLLLYASPEAHGSVFQAADLLGVGRRQVRIVAVDDSLRIDPQSLAAQIEADCRDGHRPFCVAATAGTVNTGAIDPLPEIAAICRRHGLWLHVDGAYGAVAAAADSLRGPLAGLSEADSLSLDPHKWLFVPLDAGCVLFRDPSMARRAFSHEMDYARVHGAGEPREAFAFFEQGPELSRRFRALKLWVSLKYFGAAAVRRQIERNVQVADHLRRALAQSHDFQVPAPCSLSIACFRYVPKRMRGTGPPSAWTFSEAEEGELDRINERLVSRLQRQGRFYPSATRIRGRAAIRICVVNYLATEADMEALLAEVRAMAASENHESHE